MSTPPEIQTRDTGIRSDDHGALVAGVVLVSASVVGGMLVGVHPGSGVLDRWGFSAIGRTPDSGALVHIVKLGDPLVLVLGTVLATLLAVRRDRLRALACLSGPPVAAVLVELALKPLVGRHFEGVLSYPSGNVTNVAAVSTALVLATPGRWRAAVVLLGTATTGAMAVAVIGLRWHFPTDALGAAVFGVGVVLLIDGVLHLREIEGWLPPVLRISPSGRARPDGG
jgi:membrane-associated phospholipid phosphatase